MLINTADADGSGANNGQLGAFQETLSIHFNRYICRPNDSISQENQSTGRLEFGLVQQSMLTQWLLAAKESHLPSDPFSSK